MHISNENKKNEAGFTLIELMVVVVIIGILAGLIVPRIMGSDEKAREAKAKMQIESLETALKLYKLDNGSFPTTDQGLKALVEAPVPAIWPKTGAREAIWKKVKFRKILGAMNSFMSAPAAMEILT